MSEQFSGLLFHATDTPPWLLRPVKVSNSSELYADYFQLPDFLDCPGTQFCYLSVMLPLATYHSLCSTSVTYRMSCHASGHLMLPTLSLPREAEDFPRGDKHLKHEPLLSYLSSLQPVINNSRLILNHLKTKNILLVVKSLAKKHNK